MAKARRVSKAKSAQQATKAKKQITIRLDMDTIRYYKKLSKESGVPYQTLINIYLREGVAARKKPSMRW
jgi:uncharacterized protein (DUF4415 family)